MNIEWIDAERARLKAEQDNAIGMANQCAGALKMLAAVEAEMAKVTPAAPAQPDDVHPDECPPTAPHLE